MIVWKTWVKVECVGDGIDLSDCLQRQPKGMLQQNDDMFSPGTQGIADLLLHNFQFNTFQKLLVHIWSHSECCHQSVKQFMVRTSPHNFAAKVYFPSSAVHVCD